MAFNTEGVRQAIRDFDFDRLFLEELGWDNPPLSFQLEVDGRLYSLDAVAEKSGMVAYVHRGATLPDRSVRERIERQLTKSAHEHLIVFSDQARTRQIWQWVRRRQGQTPRYREHNFYREQTGELLVQKLQLLAFSFEEDPSIVEVTGRARKAFDVDRVTRRFYDRFKKEHTTFLRFVKGIPDQGDREWYASLMLNRLMFVYFVQKKGFLDGDPDYLSNRLKDVQQLRGPDNFLSFYRRFLRRFFHEGLGQLPGERDAEIDEIIGDVPYLNGGIFDRHELERDYPDLEIADEAFEKLFDYFDEYDWHLDERPTRDDREINPEVLGYIFEKYVNQKQMGAYYTKEDITGYISRNTIIPRLFDMARKDCAIAFRPDSALWRLLSDDPDRYIYESMRKGVEERLPEEIEAGLDDVSRRTRWNEPAAEKYALPTETWREHVARRERYEDVWLKLVGGEVTRVDDLITLNLDIRRFAQDVILDCEGPELLRAFWKAIRSISVLDPACGSGAFLFAALNVLEPLYDACLKVMKAFVDDLDRSRTKRRPEKFADFRRYLKEVAHHPNRRYFILKSIIIANLYGVDIMEEAVEICKLRLFLKLAAQAGTVGELEPLPDIDFNIRAGNTLVGFSQLKEIEEALTYKMDFDQVLPNIQERAGLADMAFKRFREMQIEHDMSASDFHDAKVELRKRLNELAGELDEYLAREYGVEPKNESEFAAWRKSHRPFHWLVEFYRIMRDGGFDVVVGNPPYVATKSISYQMKFQGNVTYPDIYGYMLLRSQQLLSRQGRRGFIIPLSFTFSHFFGKLRAELTRDGTHWVSSFDNIPAALFSGVSQRCTVWISSPARNRLYASPLLRWRSAFRNSLLRNIGYSKCPYRLRVASFGIPRISNSHGTKMLKLHVDGSSASAAAANQPLESSRLGFSQTARNFISTYLETPPVLSVRDGGLIESNQGGWLPLTTTDQSKAALAVTSGDACFWYWLTRGDGFHMTSWVLRDFLAPIYALPSSYLLRLQSLGELLHERRFVALVFKKNAGKYVGNYNYQTLSFLTRRADCVFFAGLGASWDDIQELRSYAALVRAVNTQAGEKNIPVEIKRRFVSGSQPGAAEDKRLYEVDDWLADIFSIDPEVIRASLNSGQKGAGQWRI